MYGLILDTATPTSLLLLTQEGKIIESLVLQQQKKISYPLLDSIQKWDETYSFIQNLSYIAMGMGPGSFTGTRIGITLAKSLAYAYKVPLLQFESLISLFPSKEGIFYSVLDAKSEGVHVLKGNLTSEGIYFSFPTQTLPLEELKNKIPPDSLFVFHSLEALENKIDGAFWEKKESDISFLAFSLYQQFFKKEGFISPTSPLSLEPSCEKEQNLLLFSHVKGAFFPKTTTTLTVKE